MMTAILEKMEKQALGLPKEERAFLADRLLSSLGGEILGEVDSAWVAEAERRYAGYRAGKRQPVPAADVFEKADRILR
jgi:putative addiction module component (TIGR02574 family)